MFQFTDILYRSGVIPYRFNEETIEILLITSRTNQRWIIPKGEIEPELDAAESAAKEAWEEAGAIGELDKTLRGTYYYEKKGYPCQVQVFLLRVTEVLEDWLEASFRKRQWMGLEEAIASVQEPELKEILQDLPTLLKES
ncbi:MAG: NUDIX hydrolase [Cyanobacteria bacterium SBLK]|nr:NUDIX hydrolase [Cyanobacteria bacterium SBLK]